MDFKITHCFCGKKEGEYGGFHISELGVTFSGYEKSEVVKVEASVIDHSNNYERENEESGVYFGVYHINEGYASFIYTDILKTKVCSPDFFKTRIETGDAVFVKLIIKEV